MKYWVFFSTVIFLFSGYSTEVEARCKAGKYLPYTPSTSSGRLKKVVAKIDSSYLGCGTSVSSRLRDKAKELGKPTDEGGHAIAKSLGGTGSVYSNVFPIDPDVNKRMYHQAERKVEECLKKYPNAIAKVTVKLYYKDKNYPNRPSKIHYKVKFSGEHKCSKIKKTFKNR